MPDLGELLDRLAVAWALIANTWWLWVPPLLGYAGWKLWNLYLTIRYFMGVEWVLLEVKIPRDIAKSPQAMEQIFAGLQTMYWEFDPLELYWEGLRHDYIVFEVASMGGETRFYIRTPVFFRNVVEAQIYAQYPESEIVEVPDYLDQLPETIPNEEWDLFGTEFKFVKPDAYPIRTYVEFSTLEAMKEEERKVDPFSSFLECLGKIGPGEHLGYHLLMRPAQTGGTDKWKKDGEKLVAKLIGKKEPPEKGKIASALEPLEPVYKGWGEPLRPLFGLGPVPAAKPAEKKPEEVGGSMMIHLSPGTRDIVAAIERNILKPGFEVIVRMCYAARRDRFNQSSASSFIGALKTYNTQTLNAFKLNTKTQPTKSWWWLPRRIKNRIKAYKKRLYYQYYRAREPLIGIRTMKSEFIVLNTEELATIYHFPSLTAKAPLLPRIEAKRSEPPATLPVG